MKSSAIVTVVVSAFVIVLGAILFWPRPQVIRLVSPDGAHRVTLSATNAGASIVVEGPDSGAITISAMRDNGASVSLVGYNDGPFLEPVISLAGGQGCRVISANSVATRTPMTNLAEGARN